MFGENSAWYADYYRTTDDKEFHLKHFLKDYLFQHRLRYMIHFRKSQIARDPVSRLGGVTIGDDVLIAPNTLVTCDVPSHCVVVGSPCSIHPKFNATSKVIWKYLT